MRELLREVYDRLGEVSSCMPFDPQDPHRTVQTLRELVGVVLDRGYFDGRMTDVDTCQLPGVL